MSIKQMDMFENSDIYGLLHGELMELRSQLDHHRRSFFSRQKELSNIIVKQQGEIDRLREILIKAMNPKVLDERRNSEEKTRPQA